MADPNENLMIIEQIDGACEVIDKLIEQLKPEGEQQQTDAKGCKWTFEGWRKHNLKHLKETFK